MKSLDLDLDLFDNGENYLCKINIPEGISGNCNSQTELSTIIILDCSGSMILSCLKAAYMGIRVSHTVVRTELSGRIKQEES